MRSLPRVDRRIVIVVFLGLFACVFTQLGFAARQHNAVGREQQAKIAAQARLTQFKSRVQRLTAAGVVDASSLQDRIDTLYSALPAAVDDFAVLDHMESTALQSGLTIEKLQRGKDGALRTPTGIDLHYVTYDISISGDTAALTDWIAARLGDRDLIISVEKAHAEGRAVSTGNIVKPSLSSGNAMLTMTVRVWYSALPPLGAAPAPAAAASTPSSTTP